ncbi:hypothetical protein F5880DRAFT_1593341 [Lentinula raphanica]|nr:hypothetical protein F5880DRAFT_1593341 [Lentinula raphanica]
MLLQPYITSFLGLFFWATVLAATVHAAPLPGPMNQLERRDDSPYYWQRSRLRMMFTKDTKEFMTNMLNVEYNSASDVYLTKDDVSIICFGLIILFYKGPTDDVEVRNGGDLLQLHNVLDLGTTLAYFHPAPPTLKPVHLKTYIGNPSLLLERTREDLRKRGAHQGAQAISVQDGYNYISVVMIWLQLNHIPTEGFNKIPGLALLGADHPWIHLYKKGKLLKSQQLLFDSHCTTVIELLQGKYS